MTMKAYSEEYIQNIADAIREKNGEETTYKVSEMAQAILDIAGKSHDTGSVTVSSSRVSVYDITFTHSLGKVPEHVALVLLSGINTTYTKTVSVFDNAYVKNAGFSGNSMATATITKNATSVKIATSDYFHGTYEWIVW